MSKESEALNKIAYVYGYDENIKIIETALKDYEMEHALRIRLENANYELVREKQKNQKKLKALEIIKNKQVDVRYLFQCKSLRQYNFIYEGTNQSELCLTEEEYDLLKEMLQ